jgi:hypothetical protein
MTHFSLSPLLPWPWIALIAVIGLGLAALVIWARRRGGWYRLVAVLALLGAVLEPQMIIEEREALDDVVAVVVDRSGSQDLDQRKSQTETVRAAVEQQLKQLPHLDVRITDIATHDTDGTSLFAGLGRLLADVPPERVAGAILITDGQVHDTPEGGKAGAQSLGFTAPLHALVTGHPQEHDRRIVLIDSPRFGIVGKDLAVRFRMEEVGGDKRPVKAVARRNGVVVAEGRIRADEDIKLPITITHAGTNVFEIEIEAASDELTTLNNRAVVTVEGIRDTLKVLLVSGQPHIGERVWRNMLKADPGVDLVHFTILRPPEKQDGTPINEMALIAFPTRELFETRISQFDLIIFDRYAHQSILPVSYLNNIVRYVREGGALLVAAGPEFRGSQGLASGPLAAILPVEPTGAVTETPFKPVISPLGHRHPVTRALTESEGEWGEWLRLINAKARKGMVPMTGPGGQPLLVLSRENKGRIALLLSDHAWLWARNVNGGGPYLELLRPMVHWLMKQPDLEEEALRAKAQNGQIVIERQTLADEAKPVTLIDPAGRRETVMLDAASPGLWRKIHPVELLGLYQFKDGDLTAFVSVGPANPKEFSDVTSTTAVLDPIVTETGGLVRRVSLAPNSPPTVPRILREGRQGRYYGSDFIALKDNHSATIRGVTILPLLSGWHGLVVLLLALVLAWWAESGFRLPKKSQA